MKSSEPGFEAWAIVTCMATANLQGVSSMTIYREQGLARKAARRLIRWGQEAFACNEPDYGGRW